jgi:preprotein translocase subunit YajC
MVLGTTPMDVDLRFFIPMPNAIFFQFFLVIKQQQQQQQQRQHQLPWLPPIL